MSRLIVFNQVTLDGYFTGPQGDLSWAYSGAQDAEWNAFVEGNAGGGGVLLLGRITYEMMAGYWPSPMARKNSPAVAERMNQLSKVVFSRTLEEATWENTRLVKEDLVAAVRAMKKESGGEMVILGSGSLVAQLAGQGVIDEYQIIVTPVVLGQGRTLFEGLKQPPLSLKLTKSRIFQNGKVLLSYEPAV